MNNVVILLDNYSQAIPQIRGKLGLPTHDSLDGIANLPMSMKHRIELIQHIFENLQRFNWEKLHSFDFVKNEKGEVIQELSGINMIFSNEKLMGNYVTLFLISLITLSTGIIDSLALLLHDSFMLNLKHISVATVQKTISIISLQTKLKEMILDDKDYESLKDIREQLVHFNLSNVVVYSDVKLELGPGVRYAGIPMIHKDLLKGIDTNQRRIPNYSNFVYKKINLILEDILTTVATV